MGLESAATWVRQHYTLPVAVVVTLIAVLAPVSQPVIGVLLMAGFGLVVVDLLRRIVRNFRDGYRG